MRSTQAITTAGWENALPSVTLPDTWRDGATAVHLSQLGRYARTTAKVARSINTADLPWGGSRHAERDRARGDQHAGGPEAQAGQCQPGTCFAPVRHLEAICDVDGEETELDGA